MVVTIASHCFLIGTVLRPFEGRGSSFSAQIEKSLLACVTTLSPSTPGRGKPHDFSDLLGHRFYPMSC